MKPLSHIMHSDPDILAGTPFFVGTRVPIKTFIDYLEAGDSLDDQVCTVVEMGWSGKKNGQLLRLMQQEGLTILLTTDQNLRYQQNLEQIGISIIVMIASKNHLSLVIRSPAVLRDELCRYIPVVLILSSIYLLRSFLLLNISSKDGNSYTTTTSYKIGYSTRALHSTGFQYTLSISVENSLLIFLLVTDFKLLMNFGNSICG